MTTTTPPRRDATAHVEEFLAHIDGEGEFVVTDASDLDVSPDARRIAFTASVKVIGNPDLVRHVAVFDLDTSTLSYYGSGHAPRWAPEGRRLAWLDEEHIVVSDLGARPHPLRFALDGVPEYLAWRADGTRVLTGVAERGAARSDVDGSGVVAGARDNRRGEPLVDNGHRASGGRAVWLLDPASGASAKVSPDGVTVWQAAWAGPSTIVCVSSADPSESGWYHGQLALLDPRTRSLRALTPSDAQVGIPAANAAGTYLSAVIGTMSDRGLYSGELVVINSASATAVTAVTDGVDVTSQQWDGDATIVFAGVRGMETVIGRYSVDNGTSEILGILSGTCGSPLPAIAVAANVIACTTNQYGTPPALSVLGPDGAPRSVHSFAHSGTDYLAAIGGTLERLTWDSSDGTSIDGLLVVPPGPGPHPLIVNIHGGPVWAWRDEWSMHYVHTPLLVSCGYAVLHPNIRGSLGRGQPFVTDGLRDMGGKDAADITAGVDMLVAAGRVDPTRIALTGNSYGGFMSAWLVATSDRFAASVPRSPVTDWVSQHYTSNIPGFDRICLAGDPLDVESDYYARSPLYLAGHVRSPVLLMAGANDLATPAEQATMFHRALVEHGVDSTVVVYQDEGHGVRGQLAIVDQCKRMVQFFDRHLGP